MKFKKIVAVILSAVICCGSLSLAEFADNKKGISSKTDNKTEDTQLTSSNSLANYVQKMSDSQQQECLKPMSASCFSVGNVTFDRVSGRMVVESTQSTDCTLNVRFISDDESKTLADKYEVELSAGEQIETAIDICTERLPQYYIIEAQLTGINGRELCDPFCISTYTEEVQYVINSDVNDFNPERVVNFDENEKTNFVVLNEETVKAEATEETNQLVSADYEKGEFVFENADNTVCELESGDYFYIQPNDTDIIAISVDSVKQENGRTIVQDSFEDIDDMFDLVKFENNFETDEKYFDTSESEFETDGKVDEESGQINFSINRPLTLLANIKSVVKDPISVSFSDKVSIANDGGIADIEGAAVGGEIGYGFEIQFNFYKNHKTIEIYFSIGSNAEINASIGYSTDGTLLNIKKAKNSIKAKLGKVTVPTNIPGCSIEWEPEWKLEFEASLSIQASFECKTGFLYNSTADSKFTPIEDAGNEKSITVGAQGELTTGIESSISFAAINSKIASVGLSVFVGFKATAELSFDFIEMFGEMPYFPKGVKTFNLAKYNVSEDSVHACSSCMKGTISLVIKAGVQLEILKKVVFGDEAMIEITKPLFNWHYSDENGMGKGECDNYAYRVSFSVKNDDKALEKGKVKIDTATADIVNGVASLYCKNGSFTYYVYDADNKVIKSDKIKVEDAALSVSINNKESQAASGEKKTFDKGTDNVGKPISDKVSNPEISKGARTIDRGSLGKYIGYILSEDGLLYIYGCGEMYDFDNQAITKNASKVREVIIDQQDVVYYEVDEKGKYKVDKDGNIIEYIATGDIANIGAKVFSGCINMTSINMPDTITSIGDYAFYYCKNLEQIVIPEKTKYIGEQAFLRCEKLKQITIPDSVSTIGENAFSYCEGLEKVKIGKGVQSLNKKSQPDSYIGYKAFYGCISLTEIEMPMMEPICSESGDNYDFGISQVFEGSKSNIKKITITNGTAVKSSFFKGMNTVTEIVLPKEVTKIEKRAFMGCTSLSDVYYGGLEEEWAKVTIGESNEPLLKAKMHFNGKTETKINLGDVNGDGKLTTSDARMILQNAVGLIEFDENQKKTADINGDGKISTTDAAKLLRFVVGIIETLQ